MNPMAEPGRAWNWRLVAVGLALIALTAGYVLLLRHFQVAPQPRERELGAAAPMAEILIRPLSVDALNRAMQIAVYLSPKLAEGDGAAAAADRNLTLEVAHDRIVTIVRLAAGAHLAVSTFEIGLEDGSVSAYPFDSYRARLGLVVMEEKGAARIPARVTVWEGLLGFDVQAASEPERDRGEVGVTIAVARGGAFVLLALSAYGAMLVLAACALAVGILTFGGIRRPEVTLIGALAAMTFALPAFRHALPGSPPLGVEADLWVFLWTELAVVLALALLVYRWARAGPPP